jgi:hypothetical protein
VPEPYRSRAAVACLAARYLAIAQPANHQLDREFDGLKDHEGNDLAAAQARAALSSTAAAATSLRQLRGYQPRLDAANVPVEEAVQVIRCQLGLPPPDTS